jgi:hypothetical protein
MIDSILPSNSNFSHYSGSISSSVATLINPALALTDSGNRIALRLSLQ